MGCLDFSLMGRGLDHTTGLRYLRVSRERPKSSRGFKTDLQSSFIS